MWYSPFRGYGGVVPRLTALSLLVLMSHSHPCFAASLELAEMATFPLVLLSLALLISRAAAVCDEGCVCIPIRTLCGNTTTVVNWENLVPEGSSAVVDVLPGSFQYGGHITELDLSNNPTLTLYNESFTGLDNVITLDLSHSGLTALPDHLFTPLTSLQHLDLSNNELTSVNPEAFNGVNTLQTLMLSFNQLSSFPPSVLLPQLQQLTAIYLRPNPIDCSTDDVIPLLQLLSTGVVADGHVLRCLNGTLIQMLNYDFPTPTVTMPMSTSYTVTSTMLPLSMTTAVVSATPQPTPSPSPASVPTTEPPALSCEGETTLTSVGYLDWPTTPGVATVTVSCPTNDNLAWRLCMLGGAWSVVNDSQCEPGSPATQLLATVTQVTVSAENSEQVSLQLATSLTSDLTLSSRELDTLIDVVTELVGVASENVEVLNNTLSVVNTVLLSSSSQLSPDTSERLRSLVDSVLLGALSQNQTYLVLSYSHLAVGGAFLPSSNQSTLLAFIRLQTNSTVGIEIGEGDGDNSDVTVEIDGGEGGVQVTVYENEDLFNQSNCSNATEQVGGNVVTPIISVTNEDSAVDDDEVVTISYGHVTTQQGHTAVCVRWIPLNCGGGVWSRSGCALVTSSTGQLQCRCIHSGSYAVLDVPSSSVPVESDLPLISKILFHVLVSVTLPLYLTIVITILASRALRCLPTLQCVVFLSVSQGLSMLMMELSLPQPSWLCYSLATLTHYTVLVTLSWMVVYPVLEVLKVFKMIWYEKSWLIAPFAALSWVWPAIPVVVYAALKHSDFPENPELCWLEAVTFPNTFTYIAGLTGLVVIVTTLVTLLLLGCSDYSLEYSIYLKIVSALVNFVLYAGLVTTTFFAASAGQFNVSREQLVIVSGGLAFVCGLYFFISYGLTPTHVRTVMTCREDPVLKRKIAHYSAQADSGFNSRSSPSTRTKRLPVRLTDELNINYVDDYLGYPHGSSPVPLAMLSMVSDGSRVSSRKSEPFINPLYNMTLTDHDEL